MNEIPTIRPIVINSESIIPLPKPTLFDWIKYYLYNWCRKPWVWSWKKEQKEVLLFIREYLKIEVLPQLWQLRLVCSTCRDNYGHLKTQEYASAIQTILKRMKCEEHLEIYDEFAKLHESLFVKSEELAAKINGFK